MVRLSCVNATKLKSGLLLANCLSQGLGLAAGVRKNHGCRRGCQCLR